jgi:hypothetical protein
MEQGADRNAREPVPFLCTSVANKIMYDIIIKTTCDLVVSRIKFTVEDIFLRSQVFIPQVILF